ncbi:hypothetical protein R3W88_007634 [Solanum pinnatisectum]|uniref:Retrotransposon gag domain-containing protein n=1 Tax=Solanum pinnatisectum TaxID=50273 RepID=A0AAV9M5L3_9SOLN|nr:hypothetical protein R3W88_007634 [Solanum pinnatisectum]
MRLFSRSLSGEALEWFTSHETRQWPSWNALAKDFIERFAYNVEIVPDRYSLEKMKQKSNESYREFAYRWRKEAARVRPPMSEKEIVEVFVRVQEPEYYDRIMLLVGAKFAEIVKVGETIEDGLRTGKIACVVALPGSSGLLKKKREDVSSISFEGKKTPRKSLSYQGRHRPSQSSYPVYTPIPNYQSTPPPIYQTPLPVYQTPSYHYRNVTPNCANVQANYQAPPPTYQTPAPLYQNTLPNYQVPQPNYQTHSYPRYQAPRPNTPNYHQMPPPQQGNYDHPCPRFEKKPTRIFTPLIESRTKLFERLNTAGYIHPVGPKPVDTSSKRAIPSARRRSDLKGRSGRAEEFWRKMQQKDYSIVKHLEKTPAQIFVWALLISSQMHRQALMKALDDTYVPMGTNSDNLAAMINQVVRGHRISFCDEELPFEGRTHNKALHVTVMCRDKIINRVLIDDGSGLNICPLSTLRQLKFDLGKLQ